MYYSGWGQFLVAGFLGDHRIDGILEQMNEYELL